MEVPNKKPLPKACGTVTEKWGCTQVEVVTLPCTWTIDHFSFCSSFLYSPQFAADSYGRFKWRICIKKSKDWISLYLHLDSNSYRKVKAKYKFSILNAEGEKTHSKEIKLVDYFQPRQCIGFDQYISRDFLQVNANDLLHNDKLKLFCEVNFVVRTNLISGPSKIKQLKEPECKLSESFGNLFDNQKFSDVTLVVGGQELPAHKVILAVHSDVFAALFEHEIEESKLNRVTITDTDPSVVKEMLRFMYTGKTVNVFKMAGDLLAAADKYALEKLKVMCENALCTQLSVETAAEYFILANLHGADQLKGKTMDFINAYATEVVKTQSWKDMITTYSHLMAEAFPVLVTQQVPKADNQ